MLVTLSHLVPIKNLVAFASSLKLLQNVEVHDKVPFTQSCQELTPTATLNRVGVDIELRFTVETALWNALGGPAKRDVLYISIGSGTLLYPLLNGVP